MLMFYFIWLPIFKLFDICNNKTNVQYVAENPFFSVYCVFV